MISPPPWLPFAIQILQPHWVAGTALVVDGASQTLYLLVNQTPIRFWPISTGSAGFGCREGSGQTPIGVHRIYAKIGDGAPMGMVFRGRKPTGEIVLTANDETSDPITTRILWLEGAEPGRNRDGEVDTCTRYIYIHGTPRADRIGQPASAGCIRMRHDDVINLFDLVTVGMPVLILPPELLDKVVP